MKEYPILFSAAMIRAILRDDSPKTQTRRIVKLPDRIGPEFGEACWEMAKPPQYPHEGVAFIDMGHPTESYPWLMKCPYGTVGDRLWCRENFYVQPHLWAKSHGPQPIHYAATTPREQVEDYVCKPSIHMPRWASRIDLENKGVKVERLNDISEEDALAEGLTPDTCATIFDKAAGKHDARDAAWLERESDGEPFYYKGNGTDFCYECAVKLHARRSKTYRLCGDGGSAHETDGPAYCDKCGEATCVSLTEYGVERELRIEDDPDGKEPQYFPVSGVDARIAETLASGIGDLQEKHHGRLAQIGFATLWNAIHGPGSWSANPFVFAVAFGRVR